MDIKSPNERAQHIAGMAYRHIYIPSEKGKRVEVLLDKMFLPQNAYCYAMFPKWFVDSKVMYSLHLAMMQLRKQRLMVCALIWGVMQCFSLSAAPHQTKWSMS